MNTEESKMRKKAEEAAKEYIARQSRYTHPDGKFDCGGRWYPAEDEQRDCCKHIRPPSKSYPYSYLVHCRSAEHIAELYEVSRQELLREAKRIKKEEVK
jgi:hypothetical protein